MGTQNLGTDATSTVGPKLTGHVLVAHGGMNLCAIGVEMVLSVRWRNVTMATQITAMDAVMLARSRLASHARSHRRVQHLMVSKGAGCPRNAHLLSKRRSKP